MADITHIQTGAERDAGQPGRAYNQTLADLNARLDAAEARTQARIAETRADIEESRAAVEHLRDTGRFPA